MISGKVKRITGSAVLTLLVLFSLFTSVVTADRGNSKNNPSSEVKFCFQYLDGGGVTVTVRWGSLVNNTKVKLAPGSVACVMLQAPVANIRKPISITVKDQKGNTLLSIGATPSVVGYVLSQLEMNSDKVFLTENFIQIKELVTYVIPAILVKVSDSRVKLSKDNAEILVNGIRVSNINVSSEGEGTYLIALHDKVIVDPGTMVKILLRLKGIGDVTALIRLSGDLTSNTNPTIQAFLDTNGTALSLAKVMLRHYVTLQTFDIRAPNTMFSGGTVKALANYELLAGASPGSGTYTVMPPNSTTTTTTKSTTTATTPSFAPQLKLSGDFTGAILKALLPSMVLLMAAIIMRTKKMLVMAAILAGIGLALELIGW